jgi:hypothetical protein
MKNGRLLLIFFLWPVFFLLPLLAPATIPAVPRRSDERNNLPAHPLPNLSLFVWLISHQSAVLFSQNKPATSNQPTVLFSHNKSATAISHQPNEQAVNSKGLRSPE